MIILYYIKRMNSHGLHQAVKSGEIQQGKKCQDTELE